MAEEILVKEVLSSKEIEAGEELLQRLDAAKLKVIAAYWIFRPEVGIWNLEFVSPLVESEGPLWFYAKIHSLLSAKPKLSLRLGFDVISIQGPNYSFYKSLRSAIGYEKAFSNAWLSRYVVGNEIVDMYVYRFPAKSRAR